MSSIDVSQLPVLVDETAYPVMFESYRERPLIFPELVGPIMDPANLSTPYYGHQSTVLQGAEGFKPREDGQSVEMSTLGQGPTWQMAVQQEARGFSIPKRMLDAVDASSKVPALITEWSRSFGRRARLRKEDYFAGLLQDGTLTAGSTAYFDGSYVGNPDSNAGFIYDGQPFFDTAHTLTGATAALSNHTASLTLSAGNLQTVLTTMRSINAVDERGNRIIILPDTLVVGPDLEFTARQILESAQLGTDRDNNVVQGMLRLVVNYALTSTGTWWVCEAKQGISCADSGEPVIETSYDPIKKAAVVTFETHFAFGVNDWRFWYCANKAAS